MALTRETPSGTCDGMNTVFIITATAAANQPFIFIVNGVEQGGYVVAGASVTLAFAPPTGAALSLYYESGVIPPVPPAAASIVGNYPSIDEVFEYVQMHINNIRDGATSQVGESRSASDPWTPSIQYLNLGIQSMQRDLEYYGLPRTREVEFIINGLPPVHGASGIGVPDPTVQVYLGFDGFWDGTTLHTGITLPADLLTPLDVAQRVTGSGTVFSSVPLARPTLPSVFQNYLLGYWAWLRDRMYFNGAQTTMDIQILYTAGVPKFSQYLNPDYWPTTPVPWLDCAEALSFKIAMLWAAPRAATIPQAVEYLDSSYKGAMLGMADRWVKTRQNSCPVSRPGFGSDGSDYGSDSSFGGSGV